MVAACHEPKSQPQPGQPAAATAIAVTTAVAVRNIVRPGPGSHPSLTTETFSCFHDFQCLPLAFLFQWNPRFSRGSIIVTEAGARAAAELCVDPPCESWA